MSAIKNVVVKVIIFLHLSRRMRIFLSVPIKYFLKFELGT